MIEKYSNARTIAFGLYIFFPKLNEDIEDNNVHESRSHDD